MKLSKPNPQKRQQRGFSMLEVLITIVVMSFGLLGISGLMVKGIDSSTGADLSSRATQASNQMIDALRANRGNLANYTVQFTDTAGSFMGTTIQDSDRAEWLRTLARLPNGDGEVTCDLTTNTCKIFVRYNNCMGPKTKGTDSEEAKCASTEGNLRILTFISQI